MLLTGVYFNKFLFVLLFIFYIFYYKNKYYYYYIKLITSYLSNINKIFWFSANNIIIFHFQKLKYSFINYIKIFYVNKIKKKKIYFIY